MFKLDYVEFYITNVCNLNCPNCNRCNNYNFSGHTRWRDYIEANTKWSHVIDPGTIGILGGEPMTNPDFLYWVKGIADLWPNSKIIVITNGTLLSRWPDLYQILLTYKERMILEVNCHNSDSKPAISRSIYEFLDEIVDPPQAIVHEAMLDLWNSNYENIRDESWPDCTAPEHFFDLPLDIQLECHNMHNFSADICYQEICDQRIVDRNGVTVELAMSDWFSPAAVIYDPILHALTLHSSDPSKAMQACTFKKCHHIIKGRLYKCGPVGILPDFINQFPVTMTKTQKHLIESYVPAEADWASDRMELFIDNLRNAVPIAQCSLCPENMTMTKFKASNQKIRFKRKAPNHS